MRFEVRDYFNFINAYFNFNFYITKNMIFQACISFMITIDNMNE